MGTRIGGAQGPLGWGGVEWVVVAAWFLCFYFILWCLCFILNILLQVNSVSLGLSTWTLVKKLDKGHRGTAGLLKSRIQLSISQYWFGLKIIVLLSLRYLLKNFHSSLNFFSLPSCPSNKSKFSGSCIQAKQIAPFLSDKTFLM